MWNQIRQLKNSKLGSLLMVLALLASLLGGAVLVQPVRAASLVVNTTADNINPGDTFCTLREAMINALTMSDFSGLDCAAGTGFDMITFSVSGTITVSSSHTIAANQVTIDGTGQNITISGGGSSGLFDVNAGGVLALQNLTIADSNRETGGGVSILSGQLFVTNSTFSNNSARFGGAIYNENGTVNVTNSTFSGNSAIGNSIVVDGLGGAIYNYVGTLTVTNSTFDGNTATGYSTANTPGAGYGGAIYIGGNGLTNITNSTFTANKAQGGDNTDSSCLANNNCPFTSVGGGAIHIAHGSGHSITNTTMSGNLAVPGANTKLTAPAIAGALTVIGSNSSVDLKNSILANSSAPGGDCALLGLGTINQTNNLIEDDSSGFPCGAPAVTGDPMLDSLTNNGGDTETMALQTNSPAIDQGDNPTCAAAPVNNLDQRGVTRPIDGNATPGAVCDIGAVESETLPSTPTNTPTNTALPTSTNTPTNTALPTSTNTPTNTPNPLACTGNLLQNPSFELALVSGQGIKYWTEKPYEGSIAQGGGYQADGVKNAFIGPNEKLYQDVNASAGLTYTVKFWAGTHDPSQNETVKLEFLNSSGNVISSQSASINYDVDNDNTAPRVTQYTLQGTAPTGTVKVRVIARNDGHNTFKFDATCLTTLGTAFTSTPTKTPTNTPTPTSTGTTGLACTGNLLQNGSFELALVPIQNIKYWAEKPYEGSISQGGGYQADGSKGAFIGPFEKLYQDVSATSGNIYTVTFWAGTHQAIQDEKVKLEFLSASNNVIGSQSVNIDYDVDNDNTPPRVIQYTLQGTAPAGTVKVRVIAYNNGWNTFKFDAACLTFTTPTNTPTNTATPTATSTPTNTATPTDTPTPTNTATPTDTPTNTPTITPTDPPTSTPTNTPDGGGGGSCLVSC